MCKILSRIKLLAEHEGISIPAIEREIGASRGVLSKAIKNGTDVQSKWLALICEKYPHFSPQWLLLGDGDMIIDNDNTKNITNINQHPVFSEASRKHNSNPFEELIIPVSEPKGIPLVSVQAVGGFAGKDFSIQERDIEAYYVIPKFRNLNVDFLIEVVGDSMMPRIFPGDIVACSIIRNPQFIQWNKTYLISSEEQGMIVKRLKKSSEKDSYLAVSDNQEYDPFDIPKMDIRGIARVVGVIHAE